MIKEKLSDPIRMYSYNLIMNYLEKIPHSKKLLDIGCRESKFPAYMASLGYIVDCVERDGSIIKLQNKYKNEFKTNYNLYINDLLDLDFTKYDIVTSIYALQHNINKDIECYQKAAEICNRFLFITNEFNYDKEKLDIGRSDGDLRKYSFEQLSERILNPINKVHKIQNIMVEYSLFNFLKQTIYKVATPEQANTVHIRIEF
jgi:hypothetical protein